MKIKGYDTNTQQCLFNYSTNSKNVKIAVTPGYDCRCDTQVAQTCPSQCCNNHYYDSRYAVMYVNMRSCPCSCSNSFQASMYSRCGKSSLY